VLNKFKKSYERNAMNDHYYSKEQESPLRLQKIVVRAGGDIFDMTTASGIFSKDGLDQGTRLLIEMTQVKDKMKVLDLGCGYGVLGIALLRKHKHVQLMFSDVNQRAVDLTKQNMEDLGLQGRSSRIVQSDRFENIPDSFDAILLNPPQAAGRAVCYALIEEAHDHLIEGGFLEIVARHVKGGAMLEKKMKEVFGNVTSFAKQGGFRIYSSTCNKS
jgi:16S rRNA (guanine1207-N2)-methyltransferase